MKILLTYYLTPNIVATSYFATLAIGLGGVYCSRDLHYVMLHYVFRWPMELFDTTPLGRIVNRFSKDIDTVDNVLPLNMRVVITQAYAVILLIFEFFILLKYIKKSLR